MKTKKNSASAQSLQHLDPISRAACRWMSEHPRTVTTLLWLQAAALAYVIYNYHFTIA